LRSHSHDIHLYSHSTHPAATETSTLSLHDALPILASTLQQLDRYARQSDRPQAGAYQEPLFAASRHLLRLSHARGKLVSTGRDEDRKSTRLNSSHVKISYAVFCLKKKTKRHKH